MDAPLFLGDFLKHGHGSHRVRPVGVEREVGDGLHELVLGQIVSQRPLQVGAELVGAVQRDQGRDGDQGRVTAKAMTSAMSSAVMASCWYIRPAACLTSGWVMWSVQLGGDCARLDDHDADIGLQFLAQRF